MFIFLLIYTRFVVPNSRIDMIPRGKSTVSGLTNGAESKNA